METDNRVWEECDETVEYCGPISVRSKYVLFSLVNNKADWPMAKQDFWGRENARGKKDSV